MHRKLREVLSVSALILVAAVISGCTSQVSNQSLTPQQRQQAEAAERQKNLEVCLDGDYPYLCKHDLLTPQQRQQAEAAERQKNLEVCLDGDYPYLCKHDLLTPQQRQQAEATERQKNLEVCLDGDYPYLCKHDLLTAEQRVEVERAGRRRNREVCLSETGIGGCREEWLSENDREQFRVLARRVNARVCQSDESFSSCDERFLSSTELREVRSHWSFYIDKRRPVDELPMTADKRRALRYSYRLGEAYFRRLFGRITVRRVGPAVFHAARDEDPQSDRHGLLICWVQCATADCSVAISDRRSSGELDEAYRRTATPGDVVLATGGFWDHVNGSPAPVGLVISNGSLRNGWSGWADGGVLFQSQSCLRIAPPNVRIPEDVFAAVQSKPILIQNGQIDVRSDRLARSDRIAIALAGNGQVLIAGAFDEGVALSLIEFARALVAPGGPGAAWALNLDGGPAAHLYVPDLRAHYGNSGSYFLNNVISLRRWR